METNSSLEKSIENKKNEIEREQHAYILEQTAVQLKNRTEKELMDQYRVRFTDVQVHVNDEFFTMESDMASINDHIERIDVSLQEAKENIVAAVQEVHIQTTKTETESDEEHLLIAKFLAASWGIDAEKIQITVEKGRSGR